MIQRYDANGFPLPDVPVDGNFNVNFGREANYATRGPKSAVEDLEAMAIANIGASTSADRTPSSGKYVYDSATGQYIWVPTGTTAPAPTGLSAVQGYQNSDRGGGGRATDGGYSPNSSPMSNSINGSLGYQAVDALGNLLSYALPDAINFPQAIAQQMNPGEVAKASEKAAQAQKDAVEGYASGKMFGSNVTSAPSTYGGAGYSGIGGTTSQTGAGSTTNMGRDPSQAQGQGAYSGGMGNVSNTGANQSTNPMGRDPSQRGIATNAPSDSSNSGLSTRSVSFTGNDSSGNSPASPAAGSEGVGRRDAGGDTSGGGGGGGGRVICTHFYRKGEMDRDMWRADLEFTFKHLSPTTVRGYQYWAIPYVKLMRKSKLAEDIIRPLAFARAKELTYQMGRSPKGSVFGKVVRLVCEPICFTVGLFVGEQNWQALWTPVKD